MYINLFHGTARPHLFMALLFPNSDDGGGISLSECAADCNCDTQNFFPVCGADNRIYFSPCHAGCTGVEGSNVSFLIIVRMCYIMV